MPLPRSSPRRTSAAPTARARPRCTRSRGVTLDVPGRPVHRDHGPVGLRQVHADAPAGRPRPADLGLGRCSTARSSPTSTTRPHAAAPRPARLRLPGLQPRAGPHRRGEHPAAAHARGPQARQGVARRADRGRRPRATASRTARPSSPAASSSASPWRARSSHRPGRACSPTSRPATWTRKSSEEVLGLLRRAVDEFGQTVVMVTHDAARGRGRRPHRRAARRQGRARRRGRDDDRGRARPDEGGGVTCPSSRSKGLLGAQAAHGPDRLRRRPRRRLRRRHARLHRHDRRVVQGPVRARPEGHRRLRAAAKLAGRGGLRRAADDAGVGSSTRSSPRRASTRPRAASPPTARCSTTRASRSSPTARRRSSSTACRKRFDPLTYSRGRPARRPTTRSRSTAARPTKYGFKVGDNVTVPGDAPAKQYKVSGIATLGDSRQPRRLAPGR